MRRRMILLPLVVALSVFLAGCSTDATEMSTSSESAGAEEAETENSPGDTRLVDPVDGEADVSDGESGPGQPCVPGPDPGIGPDDSIDPDRRGEALVLALTGIDELAITEENEGEELSYDDPNYGGVYGDFNGGWVVAVVDCSLVDANEIAGLAGGTDSVTLIEVPYSFEEVNAFRDQLARELETLEAPFGVGIDSTLTGRYITVTVEDAGSLPTDFGQEIPPGVFTIEEGTLIEPGSSK